VTRTIIPSLEARPDAFRPALPTLRLRPRRPELDTVNSVGDLRESAPPIAAPARVGSAEPIPAGETASAII